MAPSLTWARRVASHHCTWQHRRDTRRWSLFSSSTRLMLIAMLRSGSLFYHYTCLFFIACNFFEYRQMTYNQVSDTVLSCVQNGLTPMHLAAQEDHVPVAEVLVEYKAQIDPETKVSLCHNIMCRGYTILERV